ncbi:MAG: aminotransferase class IV [Thermodesulfobacteriota bacterium]
MMEIIHINGKPIEEGMPLRSLMYGEGLFETFRCKSKLPVYFERHIDRMREGARILGIPFQKDEEITEGLQKTLSVASISDAYVKIGLLSTGSPVFYKGPSASSLVVMLRKYQPQKQSIDVKVSSYRRNSNSPIVRIKSLNYLENILAKREALSSGYDEAIFLNERNELAEGTVSNIFFIKGKVVCTPSIECGLLAGIIRGVIFQLVDEFGLELREGRYGLEELKDNDGVFLTNSLIGAVAVSSIDGISRACDCEVFYKLEEGLRGKLGWK